MSKIFVVLLVILPTIAFGADIDYAENNSGDVLGLKIEGEIVQGDQPGDLQQRGNSKTHQEQRQLHSANPQARHDSGSRRRTAKEP